MSDSSSIRTHYEVLGVPTSVDSAALERAYRTALERHPESIDPTGRRRVEEAYRVLSEPTEREAYDRDALLPAEVRSQLNLAVASVVEAPDRAASLLDQVRADHGDHPRVRLRVAVANVQLGRFAQALEDLTALSVDHPESALVLYWIGTAHARRDKPRIAVRWFRDALALAPLWRDAYVQLSRALVEEGDTSQALEVLDQGIFVDEQVDTEDLPLLMAKLPLLAAAKDWDGLRKTTNALDANLPVDDERRRAEVVQVLRDLTVEFPGDEHPRLYEVLVASARQIQAGAHFPPLPPRLGPRALAVRKAPHAVDDTSVPPWIGDLVRYQFRLGPAADEAARASVRARVVDAVAGRGPVADREWAHFSVAYPDVAGVTAAEWQSIRSRAVVPAPLVVEPVGRVPPPPPAPVVASSAQSRPARRRAPVRRNKGPIGGSKTGLGCLGIILSLIAWMIFRAFIREMLR